MQHLMGLARWRAAPCQLPHTGNTSACIPAASPPVYLYCHWTYLCMLLLLPCPYLSYLYHFRVLPAPLHKVGYGLVWLRNKLQAEYIWSKLAINAIWENTLREYGSNSLLWYQQRKVHIVQHDQTSNKCRSPQYSRESSKSSVRSQLQQSCD